MVNKDISSEKEPSEKKRRKTSNNTDASSSKHQKEDVYEVRFIKSTKIYLSYETKHIIKFFN